MPIVYDINADDRLVTIRVFDRFTEAHLLDVFETIRTDPDYRRDMHRLWDLREVDDLAFELDQMPQIRTAVGAVSQSGRTAIVVGRTVDEIVAQYFCLYFKERMGQVFWEMGVARAWLLEG